MKALLAVAILGVTFTSGMWLGVALLPTPKPTIVPVYVPIAPAPPPPTTDRPA